MAIPRALGVGPRIVELWGVRSQEECYHIIVMAEAAATERGRRKGDPPLLQANDVEMAERLYLVSEGKRSAE
jgi:hypothetical protein